MKKSRLFSLLAAAAVSLSMLAGTPVLAGDSYNYYYNYTNSSIRTYTVQVTTGYLALRTEKSYNVGNEIGELYTGDIVQVTDTSDSTYWYIYAPSLGKYGYVNKNYLVYNSGVTTITSDLMTVSVASGYLALRNDTAYDSSNEIGKLYTGDVVTVLSHTSSTYWYVYSPKYDCNGYVNRNYLTGGYAGSVYPSLSVKVDKGYLALRTWRDYDSRNEIGELYTGNLVQVIDSSDSTYWYVYAPILGKYGYVNKNYLVGSSNYPTTYTKTVSLKSGYLALRNAMAYDSSNEIGKLYNGDVVQVTSQSDSTYWYVYAPSLGKYGYVNKNYLY